MKSLAVSVTNVKWDRSARQSVINIGFKEIEGISYAPLVCTSNEMVIYQDLMQTYRLKHEKIFITKLLNAESTILPVIDRAKNSSMDGANFNLKNKLLNDFLEKTAIIVDPATDALMYEKYTKDFSICPIIPHDLRQMAGKMFALKVQWRKSIAKRKLTREQKEEETKGYLTQKAELNISQWSNLFKEETKRKLQGIIYDTLIEEFRCGADIGLAPVPVIDSEEMLNFTKEINRLALANWPKGQKSDNCATYLILAPTVLSNESLMDKIIEYIQNEAKTKFIVFKFKNLELDKRGRIEEKEQMKRLLTVISRIKHERKDDVVLVLLEAGYQMYPMAAGGFDIVSTCMTGQDTDWIFRRKENSDTINGYFDKDKLIFRNDAFLKKKFANGGLRHSGCPACEEMTSYRSAKMGWSIKRRQHYLYCANELYSRIYSYIDQKTIELAKADVSRSEVSNLKSILPYVDYV